MAKQFIKEVAPYKKLYRDDKNGIAWIEDGSSGCGISIHPNIAANGSVRGMKDNGYWQKDARTVRSHGFIYNIDHIAFDWYDGDPMHEFEKIVANEARPLSFNSGQSIIFVKTYLGVTIKCA